MIVSPAIVLTALLEASQLSGMPIPSGDHVAVATASHALGEHLSKTGILGVTSFETGAVFVYSGWEDLPSYYGHCILVHEMVHHLQFANNLILDPVEANEPEAWAVTAKCFEQEGHPAWAAAALSREREYIQYINGKDG